MPRKGDPHRSEKYVKAMKAAWRRIETFMEQHDLVQTSVAERAGVQGPDFSKWKKAGEEDGLVEMGVCRFFAVCEALDLDPVWVLRGEHWYAGQTSGYDHVNRDIPLRTKRGKARGKRAKRGPADTGPLNAPAARTDSTPPPASVRRPSRPSSG